MTQVAMTHVATLVCDPARPVLTGAMLRRASEAFSKQDPPRWLAQNIAADIFFEPGPAVDAKAIADRVRAPSIMPRSMSSCKRRKAAQEALARRHGFDHDWPRMS